MVEGIEEFCAKLETGPLVNVEELADGQVCALLPRTLQDVFSRIAEAVACRILKVVNVKPHIDVRMGDMSTADLLRAHQSLRTGVGWVIADYWRKREA